MVADWILAGSTTVLAGATVTLAWFTLKLYKATLLLAQIDKERDRKEVRSRIRERIEEKRRLAEVVLGWAPRTWLAIDDKGTVSFTEAWAGPEFPAILRTLALLVRPEDEIAKHHLEMFLEIFDKIDRGMKIEGVPAQSFVGNLVSVQDALQKDLPRWRAQVIELGYEEEKEYQKSPP